VIDATGELGQLTGLGTQEILLGSIAVGRTASVYSRTGDIVMIGLALVGVVTWWQARRLLVGSHDLSHEEE
jgi:apolipoprotein N-acyltransferase